MGKIWLQNLWRINVRITCDYYQCDLVSWWHNISKASVIAIRSQAMTVLVFANNLYKYLAPKMMRGMKNAEIYDKQRRDISFENKPTQTNRSLKLPGKHAPTVIPTLISLNIRSRSIFFSVEYYHVSSDVVFYATLHFYYPSHFLSINYSSNIWPDQSFPFFNFSTNKIIPFHTLNHFKLTVKFSSTLL